MEVEIQEKLKERRIQIDLLSGKIKTNRPDILSILDKDTWKERLENLRLQFDECEEQIIRCIADLGGEKYKHEIDDLNKKKEDLRNCLTENEKAVKERMQYILSSSFPQNSASIINAGQNKQKIFIKGETPLEFVKSCGSGKKAKYKCLRCFASSNAGKDGININSFKLHCLKKHQLKIDIRNRTGELVDNPKYNCEICTKELARKNNLETHYLQQHQMQMISKGETAEKQFTCLECKTKLTCNDNLAAHVKECTGEVKKIRKRKRKQASSVVPPKGKKSSRQMVTENKVDEPELSIPPRNLRSTPGPDPLSCQEKPPSGWVVGGIENKDT